MSQSVVTLHKFAAEVRTYVFDFGQFPEVRDGETLSAPIVPPVAGLTIGTPAVTVAATDWVPTGKGVAVSIAGGTAGEGYAVACTVSTSGGSTLEVAGLLAVN